MTPPHNIVLYLKLMTKLLTSKSLTCETPNSERAVTGYFTLKKLLLSLSNILSNTFLICWPLLNQDLIYGEILAGRPGAWLVKKILLIWMQSKKLKIGLMLKLKMILRTC